MRRLYWPIMISSVYDSGGNLNQQALFLYCEKVRKYLEKTHRFEFDSSSSLGSTEFPGGCCDDTSQVLATLIFDKFGVIPKLYRGNHYSAHPDIKSHVWLEVEGITVDITIDQFNDSAENYNFPPVYVGDSIEFYNDFEVVEIPDGRHYSGCAKGILHGVYEKIKAEIEL